MLLPSSPAQATPPRIFTSDDLIVAATQTHLYVVRDLQDNQGSHFSALVDQHLVEIDLNTHNASRSWLLRSIWVNGLGTDDYLSPGEVVEHSRDTADMFAVFREVGAAPVSATIFNDPELSLEKFALLHAKTGVVASFEKLAEAARAQLLPLAETYPHAVEEAELRAAEKMEVYDLSDATNWRCEILPFQLAIFRADDKLRVVKIACDDDYETGAWTFHMALPDKNWE